MESTCSPTLVGIGFRPTDEELVNFYLKHKLLRSDDPRVHVIPVIDLCHVEPWQVPDMLADSVIRFNNDPEWFFFSPVDFKYSNSKRFNRTTECGFWKPTGKERDRTFVLCRLIKKPEKTTDGGTDALIYDEGELSIGTVSDFENQATAEGIPAGGSFTGMETISPATYQAEKYFFPTQQSPTGAELGEPYFQNYPFNNAYYRNENNIMQTPFKTTDLILVDDYSVISEESTHPKVNNFTESQSLKWVYCESSDIDTEIVSKLVKLKCAVR
ncbi:hypothetical protein Fmac_010751 [Flemingia macrophylla]|uniref:NAC domain-containing protein n=1 Tax=Flemingia macrophylla TaxID=520843 RepID=A0ABD1MML2_9FABA